MATNSEIRCGVRGGRWTTAWMTTLMASRTVTACQARRLRLRRPYESITSTRPMMMSATRVRLPSPNGVTSAIRCSR